MSTESKVGSRVFELRDFVKNNVDRTLIDYIRREDIDPDQENIVELRRQLKATIDESFNRGIDNVLSAFKK